MGLDEYLDAVMNAESQEDASHWLLRYADGFGFSGFMMAEFGRATHDAREVKLGPVCCYDKDWLEYYTAQEYVVFDPVVRRATSNRGSFFWSELQPHELTGKSGEVMNEARAIGLVEGAGFLFILPGGIRVGLGMGGPGDFSSKSRLDSLFKLEAAAYGYCQLCRCVGCLDSDRSSLLLSRREIEVLQWLATGKTKDEIAQILHISCSCIKRYCENIGRKLDVHNTVQAVVEAIRLGIIEIP